MGETGMTAICFNTEEYRHMSYFDSAEGITITRARALKELERHGVREFSEFFRELGDLETYDAVTVLFWLGY